MIAENEIDGIMLTLSDVRQNDEPLNGFSIILNFITMYYSETDGGLPY